MHRVEDDRLIRGKSCFIEDLDHTGALHAVFVRSHHAYARLVKIDSSAAMDVNEVNAVFTGTDFVAQGVKPMQCSRPVDSTDGRPFWAPTRHVLALETVRFVGDPVAMVIAKSLEAALDAAELVDVDYEPMSAVVEPAKSDEVAVVRRIGDETAVREAFQCATHVVRVERLNNRISALPLETRSAIGHYDRMRGVYRLDTQTQGVHLMRTLVAASLGIDEERLRVVTQDVGGSFGMKLVNYPEQIAVLVAARLLAMPVRWVATRSEAFLTDTQARDHSSIAELALDETGRILALRCVTHGNMGAYASSYATSSPILGFPRTVINVYRIPQVDITIRAAYTHTTPTDAFRGAGKPEGVHLMERLIDEAARKLRTDRMTLRMQNLVTSEEMPYHAPNGEVWDCGDFPGVMHYALHEAAWDNFESRREESHAMGLLRGFGIGLYLHTAGAGTEETSMVEIDTNGQLVVYVGQQALGQGHETAFAQLLGEHLGVDPQNIEVIQGDTDRLPPRGASTGGSQSLQCAGTTVMRAADLLVKQLMSHAAEALNVLSENVRYESGFFSVKGTNLSVGIGELGVVVRGSNPRDCTAFAEFEGNAVTIPNGAYVCEVEVDPETGEVRLCQFVGVNDVGRRLNPAIVDGQLHGGIVHGIGQAWLEHVRYEHNAGQMISGSLMEYAIPRADHFPPLKLFSADIPTHNNTIGAKGVGELGCLGAPAAFMNALADAIGTQEVEMPATPEQVWRALAYERVTTGMVERLEGLGK